MSKANNSASCVGIFDLVAPNESTWPGVSQVVMLRYSSRSGSSVLFWC